MNGMPLPLAVMIMLPEPWSNDRAMNQTKKDFYQYYATMMEPWDGPAAIAYSDGRTLGASLDRNGLRPARYYITHDQRLLLSSEVGTLDIDPADILEAGCLGPGEMLLVQPDEGRVLWNDEIRNDLAAQKPFRRWIGDETLTLEDLAVPEDSQAAEKPAPS